MHLKSFYGIIFFLISIYGFSQVTVKGKVFDQKGEAIPGATIRILNKDSALVTGVSTGPDGDFSVSVASNTKFTVMITSFGYNTKGQFINITTKEEPMDLGTITLKEATSTQLKEVQVVATQIRGEQKGDTVSFNADAFKTNPDASAEDLVKKMPGITSDNSGIKVNGEQVQKVLVDGKPFFGDDPNAALKNLPADIIDKVEVFDKSSDQAAFTGFNDGDQQKTINIVTKKGKNVGQFGRVYGGIGADETPTLRYGAGAAVNNFKDKQRLSVLLLSNNINQQNFSAADITGAMGGSSGGGGRRNAGAALMASPTNGNTTTQSAGINYTDEWGKKTEVSGSYFFNSADNRNISNLVQNYFTDNRLVYRQSNNDRMLNTNHRVNFRFEHKIDSANKIIVTPSFNFQDNRATRSLIGSNMILDNVNLSRTQTGSSVNNIGYDFNNNILLQHKFRKKGRTISLNVNTGINERNNNGTYNSYNIFGDTLTTGLDQLFNTYSYTKKISPNLSYTEPLNNYAQLQVNYNPSFTESKSDKTTRDFDTNISEYSDFNTGLSNKYTNVYRTQRGGLSYRYHKEKLNLSFGVDAQQSELDGEQTFPAKFSLNQKFQNVLPNARLNYKFNKTTNLRLNYRTSTNIPNVSQLQNVIDISNPLQIRSGNSDLKQTFENSLFARFGGVNTKTARNLMLLVGGNYVNNYISNATYILRQDSVIQDFVVKAGSQLTKPINLDGYYSARAFLVYGFPLKALKSNMNINGGVNYNHTPSYINDVFNFSNSYATNAGIYIGSNVSENLDFSLNYNGNYTVVKNTVLKKSDNNFFSHTATFKVNWIIKKSLVINSDVSHTMYQGLTQSFNQQFLLWNAYIGYKFLKNKSLEAKVSVFDILNKNRSINRTVTGAYTEDSFTNVLRRYGLFTLTYTLKNFKNGTPEKVEENPNPSPSGPPPGMRRERGN